MYGYVTGVNLEVGGIAAVWSSISNTHTNIHRPDNASLVETETCWRHCNINNETYKTNQCV